MKSSTTSGDELQSLHPMDRGYSWMVCLGPVGLIVFATTCELGSFFMLILTIFSSPTCSKRKCGMATGAFFINFLVNGSLRSTGIIFVEVLEMFQANPALTAVIMAFLGGGYALFAFIGNVLGTLTSMRFSCLIGAVLAFIAIFFTATATNIYAVILFFGLIGGASFGFLQGPSLVIVAQYFNKRRALAIGISAAGGSIGTLVIPQFLHAVIVRYGFRGAMALYAAIALHAIPASMLLRPTSFYVPRRATKATQTSRGHYNQGSTISDEQDESLRANLSSGGDGDDAIDAADAQKQLMKSTASTGPATARRSSVSSTSSFESMEFFVSEDGRIRSSSTSPSTEIEPPRPRCGGRVASKLCNRHLLCGLAFWFFTLALTFGQGGYFNTCFFVPPLVVERWHSKALASTFLTVVGICDFFGRICTGWFSDLHLVGSTSQMGGSLMMIGLATVVAPFVHTTALIIVYALLFGSFGGAFQGLIGTVLADVFGLELLPLAFGLSHLVLGFLMLPLPPIFGKFKALTGTFSYTLHVTGVMLIVAGVAACLIPLMSRVDRRRSERDRSSNDGRGEHQLLMQSEM